MATMSIPGGSNHNVTVYGSGTVIEGNGNDSIRVEGSGTVIVGDGRDMITMLGNASVSAGSGDDLISIGGIGHVSVGGGNDTLTLSGGGEFVQSGLQGHDTITLGTGNDTIYAQGSATIQGSYSTNDSTYGSEGFAHGRFGFFPDDEFGRGSFKNGYSRIPYGGEFGHVPSGVAFGSSTFAGATIAGGELQVLHSNGVTEDMAVSGKMTLVGGQAATEFVGGSGSTVMRGGLGNDTFVGGSGHDTMVGGSGHNVFEFLASEQGGQHVITNFVSSDQLDVEGQSLDYLLSHHEVTTRDGNTFISVDGGKTTIELQGVSETDPTRHPIMPHEPFGRF